MEVRAELIQTMMNRDFPTGQLEESVLDYVLRCTNGLYYGNYIYLNVTQQGELIGSSNDKSVTLSIDDSDIGLKHASIKLKYDEESNKQFYELSDLKSGKETWVKIRYYYLPVIINNNIEIKIGKKQYIVSLSNQEVDQIQEWLQIGELSCLNKMFVDNKIQTINDLRKLRQEQIIKLFTTYGHGKEEMQLFNEWHQQIEKHFPQPYTSQKLQLIDKKDNKVVLVASWIGATMSSKTYVYEKPPDKLLQKEEFEDYEENPIFELMVRYMYGKYLLETWKYDNYSIYFKVEDNHILQPDDVIKLGNQEFVVQRFNTGFWQDQGTRNYMEDKVTTIQDLGVSSRVPVSCFGVFDGHKGDECVKYVSSNLFDKMRELILQSETTFDQQKEFYSYIYDVVFKSFIETDQEFYNDYKDLKGSQSGCVCAICLIIGDYIVSANIGDCRAILCSLGQAIALSVDHKPYMPDEKLRIEQNGGQVINQRISSLSVSRAFGDFNLKRPKCHHDLLTVEPDIRTHKIDYKKDEFIVICSDGVLEAFNSNQELINFIREKFTEFQLMEQDPQQICKDVLEVCYETTLKDRNCSDNLSIIIINLTRGVPPNEKLQAE